MIETPAPASPVTHIPPHDCLQYAKVTKCDNVTDECCCRICGKIWEEPCNFDEEYD